MSNPKTIIMNLQQYGNDIPDLGFDFFNFCLTLLEDAKVGIPIWEFLLQNSKNNLSNISSLNLLEVFMDKLPESLCCIDLLLSIDENELRAFTEKKMFDYIVCNYANINPFVVSSLFCKVSRQIFETDLEDEKLRNFLNFLADTNLPEVNYTLLKGIKNLAKISHYNGLFLSHIIIGHFSLYCEDSKILKIALSSLSDSLSVDTQEIPNFSEFWILALDILHSDDEEMISSICNFFESSIIEFSKTIYPNQDIVNRFLELSNSGNFQIKRRSLMILVELCKIGNIDEMKYIVDNGALEIFFEYIEEAKDDERTEILQTIYRILLDYDSMPDELYVAIHDQMEQICDFLDQDNDIETELYDSIMKY
ncbi:hypothetical protein TVAG_454170 [Trichomonas vaginalis G3]|uniref:Uncharacterized protein n=1 Tax=Trichomonas vaginalis (strain ATCC PRA-98 / G3) TaxID=412133 RepID=A2DPZ3_TRIV3|nr:armadillo (ARM) repeat-containing protein family [Trichomonas vaginalis G3]EAY17589.1 hypothetical protein TVAG_454170 [Trichomonas vaginalis G3]KAI5520633.1 armadillo (ARM) repeat-containing protein family [Trichomonas vaginalis G3]|eukprot:XP_001329724.1 hypothetical protein [Trichomonas vaginalis G3]